MLHEGAATNVNAFGGETGVCERGREGDVKMIAPLPAQAFVGRALIENRSVTEPMVMPVRVCACGVDCRGVRSDDRSPACAGDGGRIQRPGRRAADQ